MSLRRGTSRATWKAIPFLPNCGGQAVLVTAWVQLTCVCAQQCASSSREAPLGRDLLTIHTQMLYGPADGPRVSKGSHSPFKNSCLQGRIPHQDAAQTIQDSPSMGPRWVLEHATHTTTFVPQRASQILDTWKRSTTGYGAVRSSRASPSDLSSLASLPRAPLQFPLPVEPLSGQ